MSVLSRKLFWAALVLVAIAIPACAWAAGSGSIVGWGDQVVGPITGKVVKVAAGGHHSLGLKADGSIVAWGYNYVGECNVPSPNTGFVAVAAGGWHSLGLKANGSIVAWGGERDVPSPNTGFVAIAAGGDSSDMGLGDGYCLGLKSDGSIVAWGDNSCHRCDVPSPNTGFVAVATGAFHSLGLKANGSIVAWGDNSNGECNVPSPNTGFVAVAAAGWRYFSGHPGGFSLGLKADGSIVVWGSINDYGRSHVPSPNTGFVAIAAAGYEGDGHSLGLKGDGSVVAWGRDYEDQCNVPSPNTGFVAIAAGGINYWGQGGHSLGLKADGSVVDWGGEYSGKCNVPPPNTGFVAVATSDMHSLGLRSDGSIVAWGNNSWGQAYEPWPDNVGFVAVSAGDYHSLGLRADGSVVAWGDNSYGQCDVPFPNEGFVEIAAGRFHNLGLKADGLIVVWGDNSYGQCDVPSPNTGFVAVAAGPYHCLGLKGDGSVVAWGDNSAGQCNVPSPNTGFVAIAADGSWIYEYGNFHSLGLKRNGSVVAWGDNSYGQCSVPSPNTGFVAVAAGDYHSFGLRADGSVVAWGRDYWWGNVSVPSPNTGFVAIAAGGEHSLGIKGTGSVTLTLAPTTVVIGQPLSVTAYAPGATSVRLRCEGVTRGFPELSMPRSSGSAFTLSFPTSFLMFARGSTVKFIAYATSPGGMTSSGSAILRIRDVAQPTPGSLYLETDDAGTFGLADSTYEPIVQTADRLEAKLLMTSDLDLWLHLRTSASGGAVSEMPTNLSVAEVMGRLGVANPSGTVAWRGVYSGPGQSVTMKLCFDLTGYSMTCFTFVMNALSGGNVDPTSLAALLPDIAALPSIYSAANAFIPPPSSVWQWTCAIGNAARALRNMASDEAQLTALTALAGRLGKNVSKKAAKGVLMVLSSYDMVKMIGSEIVYMIQAKGDDLTSTFTSHRGPSGSLGVTELPKADATLYRPQATTVATEPGALSVAPSVTACDIEWLISYNVTNNGASPVWSWTLYYNKECGFPTQVTSPTGWTYRLDYEQGAITWFTQESESGWVQGSFGPNTIAAGGSLAGFSIRHSTPPGYAMCSGVDATYAASFGETLAPGGTGSVSEMKLRLDSMPKVISDRVVTAVLPDRFYVADLDRHCGIGVIGSSTPVEEGDVVRIVGSEVDLGGEMVLEASSVLVTSQVKVPDPIGVTSASLGGEGFGIQPGITDAHGLNNIGLVVRCWAKVTQIGLDYLYVDDGSNLRDGTLTDMTDNVGVRVIGDPTGYSPGDLLVVTGISSCFNTPSDTIARRILTRGTSSVDQVVDSPHPYPNNYNNTWTLTGPPGTVRMRAHFIQVDVESGYDFLHVNDIEDMTRQTLSKGTPMLDFWTRWIPGGTIHLNLVSDSSIVRYGFQMDRYEVDTLSGVPGVIITPTP